MRRRVIALAAALALVSVGPSLRPLLTALFVVGAGVALQAAPPTLDERTDCTDAGGGCVATLASDVTAGSLIIVGTGWQSSCPGCSISVSDDDGNTYNSAVLGDLTTGTNANRRCQIFYAENITASGGSLVVTATIAGGSPVFRAQVLEIEGAATSSALDAVDKNAESADGTSHTFSSAYTTAASDVYSYAVAVASSTFGPMTPTGGWTNFSTDASATWDSSTFVSQVRSDASGLSGASLSWTSANSRTATNCVATFKAAGGGGSSRPPSGGLLRGVV